MGVSKHSEPHFCWSRFLHQQAAMFLHNIKNIIKPFYQRVDVKSSPPGLHATPPGQFPERGPKPSKLSVLLYLMSIVFCCLGILALCRYPMVPHGEREILLLLGLPLIVTGLLCLAITNCMVNRENKAFVNYLNLKVEQYMAQHQRNLQSIPPDNPHEDV